MRSSSWRLRSTPTLAALLGTLAADRAAGIGIGVRPGALVVSLRQARSALPASRIQGRTCMPRRSRAAGCCSTPSGRSPCRRTPTRRSAAGRGRPGRRLAAGVGRLSRAQRALGGSRGCAAGAPTHHEQPDRRGGAPYRTADGLGAGSPRAMAGPARPGRRPVVLAVTAQSLEEVHRQEYRVWRWNSARQLIRRAGVEKLVLRSGPGIDRDALIRAYAGPNSRAAKRPSQVGAVRASNRIDPRTSCLAKACAVTSGSNAIHQRQLLESARFGEWQRAGDDGYPRHPMPSAWPTAAAYCRTTP